MFHTTPDFLLLKRSQTESESSGKLGLGQAQIFTNGFHVHIHGNEIGGVDLGVDVFYLRSCAGLCYIFFGVPFRPAVVFGGRCDLRVEYGFQKGALDLEGILRVWFERDNLNRTTRTVF